MALTIILVIVTKKKNVLLISFIILMPIQHFSVVTKPPYVPIKHLYVIIKFNVIF